MTCCATGVRLLCDFAQFEGEGGGIVVSVESWTGQEAKLLQERMRLSVRQFAQLLGVNAATVTKWRKMGTTLRVSHELQQALDTTVGRLAPAELQAFRDRLARLDPHGAERRLTDSHPPAEPRRSLFQPGPVRAPVPVISSRPGQGRAPVCCRREPCPYVARATRGVHHGG